jgi:hypothetical protein
MSVEKRILNLANCLGKTGEMNMREIAETINLPAQMGPEKPVNQCQNLGFISQYSDYADVIEVPKMMHEVVAMQIIASILNKNGVVIPHGGLTYPLDLWVVLLSGSGAGRTTLVNTANPVLKAATLRSLKRDVTWGSEPAFLQDLAENPTGLFVWGELSEKLKLMNDARFGSLKQWLTDRYDNFELPDSRKYRKYGKKKPTPPIEFDRAPRINILATSSEDWFFNNLDFSDSAGGFIPRWLLVRASGKRRCIPTPRLPEPAKRDGLVGHLSAIDKLRGEADLSAILPLYEAWYEPTSRRFENQANSGLAGAYFNRHRVQILKLAVVYEVAQSHSLKVTEQAWHRANSTAKELERVIFDMLGTGMSKYGYKLKKAEERIRDAGPDGLLQSEFTRAFQHDQTWEREGWLKTLEQAGSVITSQRVTSGRTATVLVHHDFLAGRQEVPAVPLTEAPVGDLVTPSLTYVN